MCKVIWHAPNHANLICTVYSVPCKHQRALNVSHYLAHMSAYLQYYKAGILQSPHYVDTYPKVGAAACSLGNQIIACIITGMEDLAYTRKVHQVFVVIAIPKIQHL